jgi:hypothetical protein
MSADLLAVIEWAERSGLVRLAANIRRNAAAYEPLAASMHARIPQAEEAVSRRQAQLWRTRGAA